MILNSLSGRFLILTTIFVMLAEIMIFVPSVSLHRLQYLEDTLERAQIASLAFEADEMLSEELEIELLETAGVLNVVLLRDDTRQLMLSSPILQPVSDGFDLREQSAMSLIRAAMNRLFDPQSRVIRVIGEPVRDAGILIEVTMETAALRKKLIEYGQNILLLSAVISVITAFMLFLAVQRLLVKPIRGVVNYMQRYAAAPEDARGIIQPSAGVLELREAEDALAQMQTELTQALRQKDRLAQLGGAVSKISHDLRNILTSAQLFTDRIESSEDPLVRRMAPKLVNSISRAVHLCESTLAFGKAEEPAPRLSLFPLAEIVNDVVEGERLALEGHKIEIIEDIPPAMQVRADSEQLFRVISNLVRNARQAMISSGHEGEIRVCGREEPHAWFVEVCDEGPGLASKAQEHLFTPFQGGVSKGGTGLGLAIAAELMRGHGGSLDLKQTGSSGTIFSICLPKGDGAITGVAMSDGQA